MLTLDGCRAATESEAIAMLAQLVNKPIPRSCAVAVGQIGHAITLQELRLNDERPGPKLTNSVGRTSAESP